MIVAEVKMRRPKALAPTLWRTCRVLMNEERLRLFKTVIEHPDEMNVSQIARCLEIPQPHATNGLRALQARGLLGVRRERFSVFYNRLRNCSVRGMNFSVFFFIRMISDWSI